MSQKNVLFNKVNLILCGIAIVLIILGFILMTGPFSSEAGFEPDIFSTRRIRVAPLVCLSGFILMIVGILYHPKEKSIPK